MVSIFQFTMHVFELASECQFIAFHASNDQEPSNPPPDEVDKLINIIESFYDSRAGGKIHQSFDPINEFTDVGTLCSKHR